MDAVYLISVCLLFILIKDTQADTNVRLVNGKTPNEGMIQILYNGTWSTLMDYSGGYETIYNAYVVCRMLKYSKVIKGYKLWHDQFAPNATFYPYDMRCREWNDKIEECRRYKMRWHSYAYAAYAVCGNLSKDDKAVQVRLVDKAQKNPGIVEILHRGLWKRICIKSSKTYYWTSRNADVICRMLGYKRAVGGFVHKIPATHHYWSDEIIAKVYICNGKEKTIAACIQSDEHHCSLGDYFADVFCQETDAEPLPVQYRLTRDGKPSAEGYPEIRHHGVWGTVDDIRHENNVLKYICRKLGYPGNYQYIYKDDGIKLPKTAITWTYNKSCNLTLKNQSCDPWKLQRVHSEYPDFVSCKFASVPRYKVVSGCHPQLTINRTGISEKEKPFITLYEVAITEYRYTNSYWSRFYIPGNTLTLTLGDGTMYGNNLNKPLQTGKEYYAHLRVIYRHKSGNLNYGPKIKDIYAFPSFQAIHCSTTQAPTTSTSTTEPTTYSNGEKKPQAKFLDFKSVDDIVKMVFIVLGVILIVIGAGVLFYLYKRRNRNRQSYKAEHMRLDPVSS